MHETPPSGGAPSAPATPPRSDRLPSSRVLVLEDEASLRTSFCLLLERAGFEAQAAASIDEASHLIKQWPPDVVVADVLLQGAFGMDVLSITERYSPTCSVIFITGRPQVEDASKALRQGAFDYLVKPVSKEQLLRKVDAALRHKQLLDRQNRLELENAGYREHLEELVAKRTRALEDANRRLSVEIAERERVEQALVNQSMFMETLMASIPTPMFYKDIEGVYLGCNRAFSEFVGLGRENILGKTVHECWPRQYATIYDQRDKELLLQGGQQEYEGPVRLQNGEERHVMFKKAVFPLADGSVGGIIGLIVDTTQRKRLEDALREASRQAQAANRAKSEFLASMSHEIRTPMTAILGMADLLWNSSLNRDQKKYVTIVRSAGENLLELINDILDLSRVESGKLQFEDIPYSPWDLAEQACDVIGHRAREKGLELVWTVSPELPPHLMGDPGRLNQICVNLLGNAVKFTDQGEVCLELDIRDTTPLPVLHITVRDTGIGIAPDDQEAIFERFTQADASTTRRYGGTGLGLSVCKSLVESMQGGIWVESTPGAGSVFHVALPLRPASCSLPGEEDDGVCGLRVCVAAASPALRRSLCNIVERMSCEAVQCDTPAALQKALQQEPLPRKEAPGRTVVLLDEHLAGAPQHKLPAKLMELLQNSGDQVPTLLCSASGQAPANWDQAGGCFWQGVLSKPVKRHELRAALAAASGAPAPADAADADVTDLHQDLSPLRILLVEDSAPTQIMISEYLRRTPHLLRLASNGREGLERFQAEAFDLVLMDLDMPVMDGFQALRAIRAWEREQQRPATPVFACSAKALKEDAEACLHAGFDKHLSKPIRQKELLDALRWSAVPRCLALQEQAPDTEPVFLVADDSNVMRIIVSKMLKELGHRRILEAATGQEALEHLQRQRVDCLICDWNMPRMKGIDLLQELRAMPGHEATPFIMLTAEHMDEYASQAATEGATHYVTKPFRLEELKRLVAGVLLQRGLCGDT